MEEVTWSQLGRVLSSWFKMHTGRGLSENNVRCLGRKLLRSEHLSDKVEWEFYCLSQTDSLPVRMLDS